MKLCLQCLQKAYKDVADTFTKTMESRCKTYEGCRVSFANCGRKNSIKGILRHRKLGVQQSSARAYIVVDIIPIHDSKLFLANNETKDSLTFYLAKKVLKVLQLKVPVVTVTRLHVKSNMNDVQPLTGVSTQEVHKKQKF